MAIPIEQASYPQRMPVIFSHNLFVPLRQLL